MLLRTFTSSCILITLMLTRSHGSVSSADLFQNCNAPLTYNEQYCMVNSTDWHCLQQRALLQNTEKCEEYRGVNQTIEFKCAYAEICVFSIPGEVNFTCADKLDTARDSCTVAKDGNNLTCTINSVFFQTPCYRSLIHCPSSHLNDCVRADLIFAALVELKVCHEEYEEVLGNNTAWALVDQAIFDGQSYGFGDMRVFRHDCTYSEEIQENSLRWEWLLMLPIFIMSLGVILVYVRKKWRRYTYFPDPGNCPNDPIVREMARAFAGGDELTVIEYSQSTSETAEPFSIEATYIATTNLSGAAGNSTQNGSAVEELLPSRDVPVTERPSEFELLSFISNGPSIADEEGLLEMKLSHSRKLYNNASKSNEPYANNLIVKSPLLSCSSSGSGFDASRPGGLADIVPSLTANLYTNEVYDTEASHPSAFCSDPCSSGQSMSPLYGACRSESAYQNLGSERHLLPCPSVPREYTNDSVVTGIVQTTQCSPPRRNSSCGYLDKQLVVTDEDVVSDLPLESNLNVAKKHDGSAAVAAGCEQFVDNVTNQDSELNSVNLCNPTYVFFRPNDSPTAVNKQ